jgi:hypothetical protein
MNNNTFNFWAMTFLIVNVLLFERISSTVQTFLSRMFVDPEFTRKPAFYGLLVVLLLVVLIFFSSFSTIALLLKEGQSTKEKTELSVGQINKLMAIFGCLFFVSLLIGF